MNLLKLLGQQAVNAALPGIKAALRQKAIELAAQQKYAAISVLVLPFIDDLLNNWTIKL